jgi:N-acetylglucosamine-6-phosphate deacetylase
MIELIGDGRHVHPQLLQLAIRAAGVERVCLVTDAVAGAGLAEGAEYAGGVVRAGVAWTKDGATLAGSVATMIRGVQTLVQQANVSVPDAVRMASLNPARALALNTRKGSLEPRKDADLVIFSNAFVVQHTVRAGRIEYAA